ncbi:unnamed protein product [Ceutorhynchus assimilis]|uniref:MADF domain-containing protein n=1 Tax=Ceutorhynchus assimilis TaxID=467358 RepID=A0A9N9N3E3_9CUCU|nr:unnamed protein product [Ceutorhynchus assimilis]
MENFEQESILIDLIQHYSFLYDKTRKELEDNNIKENAWGIIASAIAMSENDVKKMWKNLRERYVKEKRNDKNLPSGSQAPEAMWPLYRAMSFLDKHIATGKRTSNVAFKVSTPNISPTESTVDSSMWDNMSTIFEERNEDSQQSQESQQLQQSQQSSWNQSTGEKKIRLNFSALEEVQQQPQPGTSSTPTTIIVHPKPSPKPSPKPTQLKKIDLNQSMTEQADVLPTGHKKKGQ